VYLADRAAEPASPRPVAAAAGGPTPFTDPSCLHASLGTLLLDKDPHTDPAAVLGNTVATRAHATEDGPVFDDAVPNLLAAMRHRGHRLVRRRLHDAGQRRALLRALHSGAAIVAAVDTFHLDHHWVDRGLRHELHAVVLRQLEPRDGTVRLTDAVEVTFFDGRIPLLALERVLFATDVGQWWLCAHAGTAPCKPAPAAAVLDVAAHSMALRGKGRFELSGIELAACVGAMLDDHFRHGPIGPARRYPIAGVLHGIWTYHHTLRWFGKYLGAVAPSSGGAQPTFAVSTFERLTEAAAAVERAAQDWLVVRALLRPSGRPDPTRVARYRNEAVRRLDRVADDLRCAARSLAGAGATSESRT
jgi:hypothetical protein